MLYQHSCKHFLTRMMVCGAIVLSLLGIAYTPLLHAKPYVIQDSTAIQDSTRTQDSAQATQSESIDIRTARTGLWGVQYGISLIVGGSWRSENVLRGLNSTFSGKYWSSESSAWIGGGSLRYTNTNRQRFQEYQVFGGYEHHTRAWDGISPYIGAAVLIGTRTGQASQFNQITQQSEMMTFRNFYIAAARLSVGFEWFVLPYLSLSGEQQIMFRYDIQGPVDNNIPFVIPVLRPPTVGYIATPATFFQLSLYF
jgi:hypothetical protein